MRTHSPLVVDVGELLEAPGSRRALAFSAPVPQLEVGLVGVPGNLDFDLVLEAIDGGVVVQGSVEGEYSGRCGRCLRDIAEPLRVRVAEIYRPPGSVWEEGYVISHESVDLELAVRDTVALEIPLNALCRPDCAGLCPRCGADLNDGPCGCPSDEGDLRWSALRDLWPSTGGPDPVS
ncbi:MAG: YceD family protein [Actinomycetota bacterium]